MNSLTLLSGNVIAWIVQVSLIASLGVSLPQLFRIRHPRSLLAFYQSVLVICLFLPIMEPWHHSLLVGNAEPVQAPPSGYSVYSWAILGAWIIAAGIVAKLCWLAVGLWQTRRYRSTAGRIPPGLESIRNARSLTRADARFAISDRVDGPATLGHTDPIVLLPSSFLSLDHEAQLSIACHELLHVKRNDWLVTILEEIVAAVFWFNPPMWLLLSQVRLSREQLVDAEVVLLTEAPAPYVQALLVMAGAAKGMKPIPAAPFLSDGHLARRIRSLLTSSRKSIAWLCVSYASVACMLLVMGWCVMVWFPLRGEAQPIEVFALQHRTPPTLVPWKKVLPSAVKVPREFTKKVPAPPGPSQDVMYFVNPNPEVPTPELNMGPTRIFLARGIRVLRPGDIPTPDEIALLQPHPDDRAIIDVVRTPEGIIQKITIQRRSFVNETDSGPSNIYYDPGAAVGIH